MFKINRFEAANQITQPLLAVVLLFYGLQAHGQPAATPSTSRTSTETTVNDPSKKSILDAVDKIPVPRANHTHKVPTNFPLPVYKSNVVGTQFTNTTEGLPMASLVIATHDEVQTVVNWYKQQCASQGWIIKLPKEANKTAAERTGNVVLMQGQKGVERAIITCSKGKKGFETTINITWQKHD